MNADFVSIVGTQLMGTLEPWLSCVKRYGPGSATLLYTAKTRENAEKLRDFGLSRQLGEIGILPISMGLAGSPGSAADLARKLAEEAKASGRRVCFNLDGGLNYLIGDCVLAIEDLEPIFIQSSRWRCMIHDSKSGEFAQIRLPDAFPVREILELQGVPYGIVENNPDEWARESFSQICAVNKIALPKNHLKNVEIGGIVFDLVWNPGNNRLRLFKDWRQAIPDNNERLRRERDLAHWSTDRDRSGQLYDKEIFVLARDAKSKERLTGESRGKITVIEMLNDQDPGKQFENYKNAVKRLREEFKRPSTEGEDKIISPLTQSADVLKDKTLVVCMGRNIDSTLKAICSHKPKHLVLCHVGCSEKSRERGDVSADPVVNRNVKQLVKHHRELGLENVQRAPFEVDGIFPDDALPKVPNDADIDVDVNISPGSKGQGAMLALWAKRRGFGVWSLHNSEGQCVPLYNPRQKKPLSSDLCDPHLYFRLCGQTPLEGSLDQDGLAADMPAMDAMLSFMREALAAGKDKDVFVRPVRLASSSLEWTQGHIWKLERDGQIFTYQTGPDGMGKWFEKLCAVALLRAGASRVRLNMALRWSEENERDIVVRRGVDACHRLELDVVGVYEGDLLLVSCKSGRKDEDFNTHATEARHTGAALGRFGLRVLARINCEKASLRQDGKVLEIGWRELCQPDELARQIAMLRKTQQTTNL